MSGLVESGQLVGMTRHWNMRSQRMRGRNLDDPIGGGRKCWKNDWVSSVLFSWSVTIFSVTSSACLFSVTSSACIISCIITKVPLVSRRLLASFHCSYFGRWFWLIYSDSTNFARWRRPFGWINKGEGNVYGFVCSYWQEIWFEIALWKYSGRAESLFYPRLPLLNVSAVVLYVSSKIKH